jgi:hypothetical protein
LVVAAGCFDAGMARSSFIQERDAAGTTVLEKRFTGVLNYSATDVVVSVDSQRRITSGGSFWGSFVLDGELFQGDPRLFMSHVWLARFDRGGRMDRRDVYDSNQGTVRALAHDPADDLLVLATCDGLQVGGVKLTIDPERNNPQLGQTPVCVVKVDPNGKPLWARAVEGGMQPNAIVADSTGHVWVGGSFYKQAWVGNKLIPGNDTVGGLLLRLAP